jgi:chemotaxis protein methyltransferase CheR
MNRTPEATIPPLFAGQREALQDRFAHIGFQGRKLESKPAPPVSAKEWRDVASKLPAPIRPALPCASDLEASFVRSIVSEMGIDPEGYRMHPLVRRIPACLRALRADSLEHAGSILHRHPELIPRALNALLIGTTEFFRDAIVFDALQDAIVPSLLERKRYPRVWSVACSEGPELYSVAMLFALFGSVEVGQFLGTDCRISALERARRGAYSALAYATVREPYRSMFTLAEGDGFSISPALQDAIEWRPGDILRDRIEGTWDMILCRNLAIYFDPGTADRLWMKLYDALAPGGILVVGKAEKPRLAGLQKIRSSIYQKIVLASE